MEQKFEELAKITSNQARTATRRRARITGQKMFNLTVN
jgi:hypothetical protein